MLNKKIISVSEKTDIPAFFGEWFIDKVKRGFCSYPNSFDPTTVYTCSLKPEDVLLFIFWTKNPKPFLKYLPELDNLGFKYYFQYTLTPYGKLFEPNIPSFIERIETFKTLSNLIGRDKVIWRYDPIIISEKTDFNFHIERFSKLCNELKNYTNKVVISFVDDYKTIKTNLKSDIIKNKINYLNSKENFSIFLDNLVEIAIKSNLLIETCAENLETIKNKNIKASQCIDEKLIRNILNISENDFSFRKSPNLRPFCNCLDRIDIGMYNTCSFGCLYCYANPNNLNKSNITYDTLSKVLTTKRIESKKKGILKRATPFKNTLNTNLKLF